MTGELDKAAQTYQEQISNYPRDFYAHVSLGVVYSQQGRYKDSVETLHEALPLARESGINYGNLVNSLLALQQFEAAQRTIQQAEAQKLDRLTLRNALYALAFLRNDSSAMADQQQWFAGNPEESDGLSLASDTEAYAGISAKHGN